jgi:hypothetical protein
MRFSGLRVALGFLPSVLVFIVWAIARTGVGEALIYVAPTKIANGDISLCHLQEREFLGPFALSAKSISYALAEQNCQTIFYKPLSEAMLQSYQSSGMIASDIPPRPELTATEKAMPYFWGGLAVVIALSALSIPLRDWLDKRRNQASPQYVAALAGVMCHAFALSNRPPGAAAETIAGLVKQFSGSRISADKLLAVLRSGDVFLSPTDMARLGQGLSDHQREQVMRATLVMSGKSAEAQSFVTQVQQALRITDVQRQFAAENSLVMR